MFKIIKSQLGVSIIQGMVAASVLMGAALVGTRLMTDQKMANKSASSKDDIQHLHDTVFALMQNREHCRATLIEHGYSTITPGVPLPMGHFRTSTSPTPVFQISDPAVPATVNTYMNNSVIILGMTLIVPGSLDNPATLSMTYNRFNPNENVRTKEGFGGKDIIKTMQIVLQTNPGNQLTGCYAVEDAAGTGNRWLSKEFCDSFSIFTWDNPSQTCRLNPDMTCPWSSTFVGIDAAGNALCEDVANTMDFNTFVDPTPSYCYPAENVKLVQVGNRVRIECNPTVCPAETSISWNVGSQTCAAPISLGNIATHTETTIADTTLPQIGSAQFRCNIEGWTLLSSPAPTCSSSCAAGVVYWTEGTETCQGNILLGPEGTTYSVPDDEATRTGNATFTCTGGSWVGSGTCNPDGCWPSWGGGEIYSGTCHTAYSASSAPDCSAISESRCCTYGSLSGSYNFGSCTPSGPTCGGLPEPSSPGTPNACTFPQVIQCEPGVWNCIGSSWVWNGPICIPNGPWFSCP